MHEGLFCPIHFEKAFDLVTHTYAETFFRMMHIPLEYVTVLLKLFQAPIAPIIHGRVGDNTAHF